MQTICVCLRPLGGTPFVRLARLVRLAALAIAITQAALAATPPPAAPASRTPRVLTSFLPVFSFTRGVAGNRASVENWLPAGVDPHEFQFQPRDLRKLREADLLIVAGLGLEPWKEAKLRAASGNLTLKLVEAIPSLPAELAIHGQPGSNAHAHDDGHAEDDDHGHTHAQTSNGGPNPHFWHDPLLATWAVTNICRALVEIDPAGRDAYERQSQDTVARLQRLHEEFATALAPYRGAAFVSYHDAFPYLARRYGLRLVGVVESNAAEEASARELSALAAAARESQARVLFVDGRPTRLARRLASDLGLEIATLETLETGPLETGAYEAGMRRNLAALIKAFQSARANPKP